MFCWKWLSSEVDNKKYDQIIEISFWWWWYLFKGRAIIMTCKAFIKHFRLMSRFGSSWSGLLEDNRLVKKMWSSEDLTDIQTNYERRVYQNHLNSTRNLCLHKLIVEKKTLLKETQIKHKHQNSQTSSIKPQLDKYLLNTHNISYETNIVTYMHCHHRSIIENVLKPSSKSSIWCVFFFSSF